MKTEIQELNDKLYLAEKLIKKLEKRLDSIENKFERTVIRTVSRSNYVKIPKKVASDGNIVGIFKLEEDKKF